MKSNAHSFVAFLPLRVVVDVIGASIGAQFTKLLLFSVRQISGLSRPETRWEDVFGQKELK